MKGDKEISQPKQISIYRTGVSNLRVASGGDSQVGTLQELLQMVDPLLLCLQLLLTFSQLARQVIALILQAGMLCLQGALCRCPGMSLPRMLISHHLQHHQQHECSYAVVGGVMSLCTAVQWFMNLQLCMFACMVISHRLQHQQQHECANCWWCDVAVYSSTVVHEFAVMRVWMHGHLPQPATSAVTGI